MSHFDFDTYIDTTYTAEFTDLEGNLYYGEGGNEEAAYRELMWRIKDKVLCTSCGRGRRVYNDVCKDCKPERVAWEKRRDERQAKEAEEANALRAESDIMQARLVVLKEMDDDESRAL